jgi:hypothetical protein
MTIAKRTGDGRCTYRPEAAREARMMWRRRPVARIVRWIGASSRKPASSARTIQAELASVPSQAPIGNVVALTWAQTFGRARRQV